MTEHRLQPVDIDRTHRNPGGPIEAAVNALHAAYASLRQTGSEAAYRAVNPLVFPAPGGIMQLLGLADYLAFERRVQD